MALLQQLTAKHARIFASPPTPPLPTRCVRARAVSSDTTDATRRAVLVGLAAAPFGFAKRVHGAAPEQEQAGMKQIYGYATPPDTYMGYGDNLSTRDALYSFNYPANWNVKIPTKTEKSTMGMDVRVVDPRSKDMQAFVVALTGPDYHGIVLNSDPKAQLYALATSDADLIAALRENAQTLRARKVKVQGVEMIQYDLDSDSDHYLTTVAVDKEDGNLFALMVKAPNRQFAQNEDMLRSIQDSFRVL